MLNFMRNILWWRKSEREEEEEGLEQGFHDLPHPKERVKMSPEKLAILLSGQKEKSPAYILVEHELNLRIAKVQSRATLIAAAIGVAAGVAGATAGFVLTSWSQHTQQIKSDAPQANPTRNADSASKQRIDSNVPAGPATGMQGVPPTKQAADPPKTNPPK